MKSYIFLLLACLLISEVGISQTPSTTDAILKEAYSVATLEKKNVFVLFHASWCGWCHKMDSAMSDKAMKKFFSDNYIITHLVVYESKGKENLENPGALDLLKKYKGDEQGIPYWLIFDATGKLIADSKLRPEGGGLETGESVGCPATEKEVAYFIKVLKQTSSLKDTELAFIKKRFRENEN